MPRRAGMSGSAPTDLARWLNGDSVADPGDGRGNVKALLIKLVVDVMNFNEQIDRHPPFRGVVKSPDRAPSVPLHSMKQIHAGPANGGDGHSHGQ
jgi:hypothetical protein